jgi:hypothetical protein
MIRSKGIYAQQVSSMGLPTRLSRIANVNPHEPLQSRSHHHGHHQAWQTLSELRHNEVDYTIASSTSTISNNISA